MKKFFIAFLLSATLPTLAMCSIEEGDTVCSLPSFREQVSPTYNPKSNVNEFSGTPEARLNPINRNDVSTQLRDLSPVEADKSYNSSCQFGVCLQNRSTPLFQQPRQ